MAYKSTFPLLTAEEAALKIQHGMTLGSSGFTSAGSPKVILKAVANQALQLHEQGEDYRINLYSGASLGPSADGALAAANALDFRAPYQSDAILRREINLGNIRYDDFHLSHVPQYLEYGILGKIDIAVIEATAVSAEGHVYLTTSGGASPSYLKHADKVLIELNHFHSPRLREMHDVFDPPSPPHRPPLFLYHPLDKIGNPFCTVDPDKIIGIVETNHPDEIPPFKPEDAVSARIGEYVSEFLVNEMKAGRIPKNFLPIQAGIGNVANAVMATMGKSEIIPPFTMFTEVAMNSMIDLMDQGRIEGISTCALTVTEDKVRQIYNRFQDYAQKIVIRPQVISNNPEAIRRLGVISMNTALELDIYGNVNSTHVCGTRMMNGIGGSGDFTRNAYISIFVTPSVAKGGNVSAIVPFASHVDHNEHSVQVVATEWGLADLRGKTPRERAKLIIENCAHPDYRPLLQDYLKSTQNAGHTPHNLSRAFELHQRLNETGSMKP